MLTSNAHPGKVICPGSEDLTFRLRQYMQVAKS